MGWKIKQVPGDFVVTEVIFDKIEESWKEKMRKMRGKPDERKAKYLWFTMRKEDADFFRTIGAIGKKIGISTKEIGYAGTKDKKAITYQTVSVPIGSEDSVKSLDISGVKTSDFRNRNRPIKLGEHKGNDFKVTVRNIDDKDVPRIEESIGRMKNEGIINYFGEQRFGSVKNLNAIIGKFMVLGDIESAVKAMILEGDGEYEKKMSAYLKKKPGDYTGSLRQIPLRLLKIFIHAYQAKIWNECAVRYDGESTAIPIVGHKTDLRNFPRVKGVVEEVLSEEKIDPEDFSNKEFRELSSRGHDRNYIVHPKNLEYSFGKDEINKGKRKLDLLFFLPKGSYATELVRQLEEA